MKLLNPKSELKTEKSFPGLLDCVFKYEIKAATAALDYKGPLLDATTWQQVLAFFQWTYDTTHSESQVRLFVNTKERKWAAWAFPQEARSGLSAKELDTPDMKTQRAMFGDADGWVYFGTVHHHCAISAFQSGTDEDNEKGIDGLHITIGSMSSDNYDLHARFYLGGCKFEPDLSKFWDIGANLQSLCPADLWDKIARYQMTRKASATTEYPAQWRLNLIEVKATFPTHEHFTPNPYWQERASSAAQARDYVGGAHSYGDTPSLPRWIRARRAVGELVLDLTKHPYSKEDQQGFCDWIEGLHLGQGTDNKEDEMYETLSKVFAAMAKYDVQLMDLWGECPHTGDLDGAISSYKQGLGISSKTPITQPAASTGQVLGLVDSHPSGLSHNGVSLQDETGYSGMGCMD